MWTKRGHFYLHELIHPQILEEYGEDAWDLIDPRMLNVANFLRDHLGPITINNWWWGGAYKDSCLRFDFGSSGSAHRFGCAADIKSKKYNPIQVQEFIMHNQEKLYGLGLRRIEHSSATPTWTHLDGKPAPGRVRAGRIHIFKPKP